MKAKLPRRRYTDDFKDQAITLAESLGPAPAARQLEIPVRSLENWIDERKRPRPNAPAKRAGPTEQEAELSRLRAENATLKMEREILKKAAAFFAKESK